jgi:hypothetical protein
VRDDAADLERLDELVLFAVDRDVLPADVVRPARVPPVVRRDPPELFELRVDEPPDVDPRRLVEERPELCDVGLDPREPCEPSPPLSSPFPISFFATPTAAGTATPSAAPAAIFFFVDIPSS